MDNINKLMKGEKPEKLQLSQLTVVDSSNVDQFTKK